VLGSVKLQYEQHFTGLELCFSPKEEKQVYGCSGKYLDLIERNLKKREQYTTGSFAICKPPLHQIYNWD
jgi:hypothetical protein